MKKKLHRLLGLGLAILLTSASIFGQNNTTKILFDASQGQMAGNADWIPDADVWNIGYVGSNGLAVVNAGNESNPGRFPNPPQSGITTSTSETFWKGGLSAFAVDLVKLGYTVETLPYNGEITFGDSSNVQDLMFYKVFVVCEPNIPFSIPEKRAIIKWVQAGGGLFMIANHSGSDRNNDGLDAPAIWNDLMTTNMYKRNPFGISFEETDISQTTSNRATAPSNKILNGTQGNVTQLRYSDGTTMAICTQQNPTVKALFWATGACKAGYEVMLAQSNFGAGRVVALGDSSPPDDGTGDDNDTLFNGYTGQVSGNHRRMMLNAALWLVGAANP